MSKKLTYEEVKSYVESYGCQLLSTEYKNNSSKLSIKCMEGHIYEASFWTFKKGNRCPICYNNKRCYVQPNKYTYQEVKNYIESFGYQLLSKEYKNNYSKLIIKCPIGHIYEVNFSKFINNRRCPICANKKRESQPHKSNYKIIKEYIENFGCWLLSKKYKNAHTKLILQCPEGHIFKMKYNSFEQGQRCPLCAQMSFSSKAEKEIQQYISSIYDGIIKPNDRDTIVNPSTGHNLELDIYIPEINKAIEFNGTYWHSNKFPEKQIKDKIKLQECKKANINLLVVKEQDWINNKDGCLKNIYQFILN